MISWKDVETVIINLDSIVKLDTNTQSYKLIKNFEKLVFFILGLNKKIQLCLISDIDDARQTKIVKQLALDCYFDYINNVNSLGYTLDNKKFWVKYISKLNLNSKKVLLIDQNVKIGSVAREQGINQIVLINNLAYSDTKQNNTNGIKYITNFMEIVTDSIKTEKTLETIT